MQDLESTSEGKVVVDIMELPTNCVVIVSNRKVKLAELQAFVETKFITH